MEKENFKELVNALRSNDLLDATQNVDQKKPEYQIGRKEFKAMQKSNYAEISKELTTSYVIQNIRTKQIVEIKARSPFHASSIIGWRPRHTKLIQVNESSEN